MGMLNDINPNALAKNLKDYKTAKLAYDKAHADFLKGRTIKKAEDDLRTNTLQAHNEIHEKITEAGLIALAADNKMKEAAEAEKKTNIQLARVDAAVKMLEADNEKLKAGNVELEKGIKDCNELIVVNQTLRHKYVTKLDKLNEFLESL